MARSRNGRESVIAAEWYRPLPLDELQRRVASALDDPEFTTTPWRSFSPARERRGDPRHIGTHPAASDAANRARLDEVLRRAIHLGYRCGLFPN